MIIMLHCINLKEIAFLQNSKVVWVHSSKIDVAKDDLDNMPPTMCDRYLDLIFHLLFKWFILDNINTLDFFNLTQWFVLKI